MNSRFPLRVVDPFATTRDQRPVGASRVDRRFIPSDLDISSGRTREVRSVDRADVHPGALEALAKLRQGPGSAGVDARAFAARSPLSVAPTVKRDDAMELVDPHWPPFGVSADEVARRVKEDVAFLNEKFPDGPPDVVVLLGSGMDGIYKGMFSRQDISAILAQERPETESELVTRIPYSDFKHFPKTSVSGHVGELIVGKFAPNFMGGITIAFLRGRSHGYEHLDGTGNPAVVHSTRVMARWGVPIMIATSAVGGITHEPGTITLVRDHFDGFMRGQPLAGDVVGDTPSEPWGPRFTGAKNVYSTRLREMMREIARTCSLGEMPDANLASMPGPNYESPLMIRILKQFGIDVVGMSMIPEAQMAKHMGMEFMGLGVVANPAATEDFEPEHAEVEIEMKKAVTRLQALFMNLFIKLVTERNRR